MSELAPQNRLRPLHLLLAILVFCGLVWMSYPYYRYFVDPDAVAYLTMARRAAAGERWRLINALWSPLHPAIVSLGILSGLDALLAAQLTNAFACILVIVASYLWFRRFNTAKDIALPLLLAVSFFLCYALYKQLFCDLWELALILFYLLLVSRNDFLKRPLFWILCAVIMALATYAKVYSFYFLLLHLPLTLWLQARKQDSHRFPFRVYSLVFLIQVLLLCPLVMLMHTKYGFWGLSRSGALNTSWTLTGKKSLAPGMHTLIPPPYLNSPYTWEDPYLAEGPLHGRFESLDMMKSQVGHSFQAGLQGIEAANQLSCFLLFVLGATMILVLKRKSMSIDSISEQSLLVASLIMPLGYLLLHFEARYIWLLVPGGMVLGANLLSQYRERLGSKKLIRWISIVFALSFLAYPAADMKALFRKGEDVYKLANALTSLNIRGSFTSNDNPSRSGCLAYWLGCNYYAPVREVLKREDILADMYRYRVMFYFHHQNGLDIANPVIADEMGQPAQRVDGNRIPGLQVFVIAP